MTVVDSASSRRAQSPRVDRRSRSGDGAFLLDAPDPLLGGAASLVARRFGASALVVRVAFVILGLAAGFGVVLYVAVLAFGFDETAGTPETTATTGVTEMRGRSLRRDIGVVFLTAAALFVVLTLVPSVPASLLGPFAFLSFALALSTGSSVAPDLQSGRAFGRIAVGLALMFGGLIAGAAALGNLGQIWALGLAMVAVTAGVGVVLAPWLRELVDGASDDRAERIRAEERADIAAHLHDSVLQTLTLIQNRVHEPQVASALAYQQERELRRWLYRTSVADASGSDEDNRRAATSVRAEIADMAASVEDDYMVVIDVVCVGDAESGTSEAGVLAAVREALVNAAKFSQTQQISLYVEISDDRVLAFVRDRGVGFDPEAVATDRRGIADSICARVERIGGRATIRSAHGVGTEVRIEAPR